jgi:superfamily II DNA or RNA helicase
MSLSSWTIERDGWSVVSSRSRNADEKISQIKDRLAEIEEERRRLTVELTRLNREEEPQTRPQAIREPDSSNVVHRLSSSDEKIRLFRSLFRGREDVYPRRWESAKTGRSGYTPACRNEWVPGICEKPKVKCGDCSARDLLPVTDAAIRDHLVGHGKNEQRDFTIGVYPMLPDETCWFLAVDFDKETWSDDALAYLQTCDHHGIPATLERSRSGNGGHAWIFFSGPVPAAEARRLGAWMISETMERKPGLGFESYDRMFPNQDTLPAGGFGNLIALPLQGRSRRDGNTVFVDTDLVPFEDQWLHLSNVPLLAPKAVHEMSRKAWDRGRVVPVRRALSEEGDRPWERRDSGEPEIVGPLPPRMTIVRANQIYIPKEGLPPALATSLIRLAAFQNPEFYSAQAMRLSTYGKPRVISCAEDFKDHIGLPRGCENETIEMLSGLGIEVGLEDKKQEGSPVDLGFVGNLDLQQEIAVEELVKHENGVLVAPTAFGKTVVAARMISERGRNTLVVVHRQQLLEQWLERLATFLDVNADDLGRVGGGKRKPSKVIDVALIQSLVRRGEVDELVAGYGHLIVDECHHLSAVSFEAVARASNAKFVLGLTATVTRKDGHHPIVLMQCGPIRHRVAARKQADERPFRHRVEPRYTEFAMAPNDDRGERVPIHQIYRAIAEDEGRNDLIFDDVIAALEAKRSPLVLTERRDHLEYLVERFEGFAKNVVVLKGGMGKRQLKAALDHLASIPDHEERLLVATGRYLGEGFDDHRLDTLFLTMPISWKGTLAQYVGRLHRLHHGKAEVIVYDYVDRFVPTLTRMAERRFRGYRALGYEFGEDTSTS